MAGAAHEVEQHGKSQRAAERAGHDRHADRPVVDVQAGAVRRKPALLYDMTAKNSASRAVWRTLPLLMPYRPGNRARNVTDSMMNVVVMTTVSTPRISLSFVVPSSLAVSSLCVAFM